VVSTKAQEFGVGTSWWRPIAEVRGRGVSQPSETLFVRGEVCGQPGSLFRARLAESDG